MVLSKSALNEWQESGVDSDIFDLNVQVLAGDTSYAYLLYEIDVASGKSHPDAQWRWARKKYSHIEQGGWWCSGLDPLNNWQPMLWGCFKPNSPRNAFDPKGKVKPIKYEHPPKTPTRAFFLRVPDSIWEKASERYGVPITEQDRKHGFWQWVWAGNIPVIIVEGAKKAGCLLALGYAAIALPGVTGGVRTKNESGEKGNPYLIPELQHFATGNREVYICFDRDTKRQTIQNVNREIDKLGQCFSAAKCPVKVISLPGPEKGVDDFVVAQGEDAFSGLYKAAQAFSFWQARQSWQLTYKVALSLSQRYLGEMPYPESGLVCIKSPKGTGKTQALIKLVSDALDTGNRRVLVITHRIQLGRAICAALGINYIDETKDSAEGKLFGYGLCIDSLHPLSQAQFNPEDWEGAIVILDECEQVIWHALNSSTCRENRVAILQTFQELIHNVLTSGGLVVAQDADLSDLSIDYLIALAGIPIEPWVAVNDWQPRRGRDVTFFATSNPAPLFAQMERILSQEVTSCDINSRAECCPIEPHRTPIMVVEDSQKVKGKWSCINTETQLKKRFPNQRILRIDSESVANPTHPAYGCVETINTLIQNYDIIIASPTIGTGVSIDIRGYFVAVFGIFQGAIAVNEALQAMARVRDENVPYFVWTGRFGLGKIGNGSASYRSILKSQQKVIKTNLRLLQDVDFDIDASYDPVHLRTWALMAARINAGMWDYRNVIWEGLKAEGHRVHLCRENQLQQRIRVLRTLELAARNDNDYSLANEFSEQAFQLQEELDYLETEAAFSSVEAQIIRQENRLASAEAVTHAKNISLKEAQALEDKRSKTPDELNALRKYQLEDTYGVPVTPELVLQDSDGWLPKIRLHYYLIYDSEFVRNRDKSHLANHQERGKGKVCPQDLRLLTAQVEALKQLGAMYFFNPKLEFRGTDPEVIAFASRVKQCRQDVKDFLGISINPNAQPMEVVQYILNKKLGFTLKCIRQERSPGSDARGRRKRVRVYQFQFPTDGREAIFEAWYQRDLERTVKEGSGVEVTLCGTGSDKYIGISEGVPQEREEVALWGTGSDKSIEVSKGVPQEGDARTAFVEVQGVEGEPLEATLPTEGQAESEDTAVPTGEASTPPTLPEGLKVGSVVRFCGEVQKYVVKAIDGTRVMVRSLLSGLFTHTYAHCLELADGETG